MNHIYLAVDFGASNGRVIAGNIIDSPHGKELVMEEIHRFPNRPVKIGEFLYWDFPALFADMKTGLTKASSKFHNIESIGIDTWGVDFGLIEEKGNLIANPICYRDAHTADEVNDFLKKWDIKEHYKETGIQILPINTLFRLRWMVNNNDPKLKIARQLLFMPDLFAYFLTGVTGNEYTIASTSELLLAETHNWNTKLMNSVGIDANLFGDIIMPGKSRGKLLEEVCNETGLSPNTEVIAVGSHDTASAVFAMAENYSEGKTAFLSSGTWSLLGVLVDQPILTEDARLAGFTNEGAVGGGIRLLTNITGLWILQQLVAQWEKQGEKISWEELIKEAEEAQETAIIDVDDPMFQEPDHMEQKIYSYCMEHNLTSPKTKGEYVRCICKSLATRYKKAIENLNSLLPDPIRQLVVFGGGAKNRLLTQFTSELTNLKVIIKDSEATAIGNILVQALASGEIKDKNEIKKKIFV